MPIGKSLVKLCIGIWFRSTTGRSPGPQDAAYALYDDDFFGNLGAILTFAFVGTFFNVLLVASLLFGFSRLGSDVKDGGWIVTLEPLDCLIFSSLVTPD